MNIKSFLSRLLLRIRAIFISLPKELGQAVDTGVTVTENFKTVIDNPLVDIFTALIPGTTDDNIVRLLRLRLPVILQQLKLADASLSMPAQTVTSAATAIQAMQGDIRSCFLHDLAVILTREIAALADKDFTWSDAVQIVEWYYQNKFKTSKN